MTRQVRRRVLVIGLAAAVGAGSPAWGPYALRNVPIFEVEDVQVVDHRFVAADTVRALAALRGASVWDDMSAAVARVESHPLVASARIRRVGLHRLEVQVSELRPVALVPTPTLSPVDADGYQLRLDPAAHALDLPILLGGTVAAGRVEPEAARRALEALRRVTRLDSAFAARISEVRPLGLESVEFVLLPGSPLERIRLPVRDVLRAFLRVEGAVSVAEARGPVGEADARFENEVVIRMGRSE